MSEYISDDLKTAQGQVRHLIRFIKRMAQKDMIVAYDEESGVLQEKAHAIDSIEIKSELE